jgi:aminomethyltransferase
MRTSPLADRLRARGARLEEREGRETAVDYGDRAAECAAVRESCGLTDFSFVHRYRLAETQALDLLDAALPGNVARIRYGRVLHTFLADAEGGIVGDCYVANNDQEFFLLCESIVSDAQTRALLGFEGQEVEDLGDSHVLVGVDGPRAWEVMKELFGSDVLGLPYLSIEVYPCDASRVHLLRAGKTGEFGYLIAAPVECAPGLFDRLHESVARLGGRCCGFDAHGDLRLEGRFFNVHAEGRRVRDPLALGLQWMMDLEKREYPGATAILARRSTGLTRKIVGVAVGAEVPALPVGSAIFDGATPVAEVVSSCFSGALGHPLGLAVFPVALAYSGLEFRLGTPGGPVVRTVSMPPFMPRSLTIKLDEM